MIVSEIVRLHRIGKKIFQSECEGTSLDTQISRIDGEISGLENQRVGLVQGIKELGRLEKGKRRDLEKRRNQIEKKRVDSSEKQVINNEITALLHQNNRIETEINNIQFDQSVLEKLKLDLEKIVFEKTLFEDRLKRKSNLILKLKREIADLGREINRVKTDLGKIHSRHETVSDKISYLLTRRESFIVAEEIPSNDKLETEISALILAEKKSIENAISLQTQIQQQFIQEVRECDGLAKRINQLKMELNGLKKQREKMNHKLLLSVKKNRKKNHRKPPRIEQDLTSKSRESG